MFKLIMAIVIMAIVVILWRPEDPVPITTVCNSYMRDLQRNVIVDWAVDQRCTDDLKSYFSGWRMLIKPDIHLVSKENGCVYKCKVEGVSTVLYYLFNPRNEIWNTCKVEAGKYWRNVCGTESVAQADLM